jgi:soluble lytic murein transglycosylase
VARWLETIGDPRTGAIDMIDWIELIPFRETRNYVQRVMEGVAVYRDRLNGQFRAIPAPKR